MAHRIITQVVFTGSRIVGRAVAEAWKQAQASQKYAQSASKTPGGTRTFESSGLTLDEACKILDVPPPKGAATDMEKMLERFKRLFDTNDPKNGGSFYLQSKILRARQRIEMEVKGDQEAKAHAKGDHLWKPKVYKN